MAIRLTHPVPDGTDSDGFGPRGWVPGLGDLGTHTGKDYSAPTGTPVYASHPGRVRTWWDTFFSGAAAGGNMVAITASGYETRYAHLSRYAVKAGQQVKRGELIGYVGATGAATGPHLHWELLIQGVFADPVKYLIKAVTKAWTPTVRDRQKLTRKRRSIRIRKLGGWRARNLAWKVGPHTLTVTVTIDGAPGSRIELALAADSIRGGKVKKRVIRKKDTVTIPSTGRLTATIEGVVTLAKGQRARATVRALTGSGQIVRVKRTRA